MLANNCREVRASPDRRQSRQRGLNQGLTQKKLQLLLPSSKQIMLVNSSIRYNTPSYTEQPAEKTKSDPPKMITGPKDKENCPVQTKTSIMRIQDPPSEPSGHASGGTATQMKEKSLKILAQTYNFLTPATPSIVMTRNKVLSSSINFPHHDHPPTSLHNILPGEQEGQHRPDSLSKQELLTRIARLQNLVHDIISGKVAISRPRSQRKIGESPNKRQSIKQLGEKFERREKRSVTWTKDPSPKTNKTLKSKTKIDNPTIQQRDEDVKQKSFIVKKKSNLKLDGYKPIRQLPFQKRKESFYGEGGQGTGKLKLRVNFLPNIINL